MSRRAHRRYCRWCQINIPRGTTNKDLASPIAGINISRYFDGKDVHQRRCAFLLRNSITEMLSYGHAFPSRRRTWRVDCVVVDPIWEDPGLLHARDAVRQPGRDAPLHVCGAGPGHQSVPREDQGDGAQRAAGDDHQWTWSATWMAASATGKPARRAGLKKRGSKKVVSNTIPMAGQGDSDKIL